MKTVRELAAQTLQHTDVHELISAQLEELLADIPEGYKIDPGIVSDVVVKASVEGNSIEATSRELENVPTGASTRSYLNDLLSVEQLSQWEAQLNRQLRMQIPRRLTRRPQSLAADFHDEPFYGKTPVLRAYACRGRARQGTTWFYRVATLYVIHKEVPYTLAVTFVLPEDRTVDVLRRLLAQAEVTGVQRRDLYLDKGFCCRDVITYLQATQTPTVLACPIRGKQGGTRSLCHGRRSYTTSYTFNAGTSQAYTTTVVVVRTYRCTTGRRRATWLLYVTICQPPTIKPHTIRARYRARFGVEGSYRSMRQTHAKTTARNPALRFFLLGVAFLILNLWVALRWRFCQRPRRGGRYVAATDYTLQRHRSFLRHAIEEVYGVVLSISAQVIPIHV